MKRTQIAPTLADLVARTAPQGVATAQAGAELRALLAHVRATRRVLRSPYRMPYLEWSAVVDADARLRRLSAPERGVSPRGSTVKGKSKLPANSRGATRKGGGR